MLPVLLISFLNPLALVLLCTFAAVVFASSSNLIIQYKLAYLEEFSHSEVLSKQILSIILTSLFVGVSFLIIFKNYQVGSAQLFAQRGLTRALLINSVHLQSHRQ